MPEALVLERQAIAETEQALAAGGVDVPAAIGKGVSMSTSRTHRGGQVLFEEAVDLFRDGERWNRVPDPEARRGKRKQAIAEVQEARAPEGGDLDGNGG